MGLAGGVESTANSSRKGTGEGRKLVERGSINQRGLGTGGRGSGDSVGEMSR